MRSPAWWLTSSVLVFKKVSRAVTRKGSQQGGREIHKCELLLPSKQPSPFILPWFHLEEFPVGSRREGKTVWSWFALRYEALTHPQVMARQRGISGPTQVHMKSRQGKISFHLWFAFGKKADWWTGLLKTTTVQGPGSSWEIGQLLAPLSPPGEDTAVRLHREQPLCGCLSKMLPLCPQFLKKRWRDVEQKKELFLIPVFRGLWKRKISHKKWWATSDRVKSWGEKKITQWQNFLSKWFAASQCYSAFLSRAVWEVAFVHEMAAIKKVFFRTGTLASYQHVIADVLQLGLVFSRYSLPICCFFSFLSVFLFIAGDDARIDRGADHILGGGGQRFLSPLESLVPLLRDAFMAAAMSS